MLELLSPLQLETLKGGYMKPFIQAATRTTCYSCGNKSFKRKSVRGFENEIPTCSKCGDFPKMFRVTYFIPVIGGVGFDKLERTKDQNDKKLDSPAKADTFCEFIKKKISVEQSDFDPRELGTKSQREMFLVKNCIKDYKAEQEERTSKKGKKSLTPGGFRKKERVIRLYIEENFGNFSVKDITYQLVDKVLAKSDMTDSQIYETITELNVFLKWAAKESLIKGLPELPLRPKLKKFKATDFLTIQERNLVIRNIKSRKHQIAIMILANYTRRESEVYCLRWGDLDFKRREITFSRHISRGNKIVGDKEIPGLKSSPEKSLTFDFFPGLHEMLLELGPSLNPNELVFKNIRGEMWSKNVFYEAWTKSVDELIKAKKLTKKVDLYRGTRSSTLSGLLQNGVAKDVLAEFYGGDVKTMMEHYALKEKQNIGKWENSLHLIN